jgi:hypothetical protein
MLPEVPTAPRKPLASWLNGTLCELTATEPVCVDGKKLVGIGIVLTLPPILMEQLKL